MADSPTIDPRSGFCAETKTFHSLRPPAPLPPPAQPLTVTSYVFSLLASADPSLPPNPALIDASTGLSLSFPLLIDLVRSLAASLRSRLRLSRGQVAFVLAPASPQIPVLYLALLSIGVVVSPSNPLASPSEISHLLSLSHPSVAFASSAAASKLPPSLTTVIIDSDRFKSFLTAGSPAPAVTGIGQGDTAAILYSSGTTGRVKGVALSHRNFIALIAAYAVTEERDKLTTALLTVPMFHVFGAFTMVKNVAMGHTTVLMERFDFAGMLRAVERFRVSYVPVAPPLVVALAKSELVERYDLSSLEALGCGGAPLGKEVTLKFKERFPNVELFQGYGLTESTGGLVKMAGAEEAKVHGSVGRVVSNSVAKIVDPLTGEVLGPGQLGELWMTGPSIMMGYVGDDQATASTLTPDCWLKTGDLCYFNDDGFLFIVDRLKELIKYKGYQVPPAELEQILQSLPEIADAAVIPYPDEEAGEIPLAFVVRQPGSSLNEEQIMDYVAKQVAPYKKIRSVVFIGSIPKSPAGKILRRELIKLAVSKPKSKL